MYDWKERELKALSEAIKKRNKTKIEPNQEQLEQLYKEQHTTAGKSALEVERIMKKRLNERGLIHENIGVKTVDRLIRKDGTATYYEAIRSYEIRR